MRQITFLLAILLWMSACKKDNYYNDSGTHDPLFKGTTMDYLDAVPFHFDTIAQIVRLAGMEDVFKQDTMTFFCPTDRCVERLVEEMNDRLYEQGYDTVINLSDIPQHLWARYLQQYMFHGKSLLKDYPQIDYDLLATYPGQGYLAYNGRPMNIGVIFHDDNGVRYVGYRQLSIAYIPNPARPTQDWRRTDVATCNIQTYNGAVHVLRDSHGHFGFDFNSFLNDMIRVMGTED